MAKKSQVELAKAVALTRLRNRARLEASVRVDIILNEIEDSFLDEFDRRVQAGEPFELTSYEGWVTEALDEKFPALPSGK